MSRRVVRGMWSWSNYNCAVHIASSAPTRIDLAGGTIDIWPLYLFHDGAQTLNAAISLRAHAGSSRATTTASCSGRSTPARQVELSTGGAALDGDLAACSAGASRTTSARAA